MNLREFLSGCMVFVLETSRSLVSKSRRFLSHGTRAQTVCRFSGSRRQAVEVEFTRPDQSSDGGVVLLQAIDRKLGLTHRLASVLTDGRQSGKVKHPMLELIRSRVFAIACGYPDCNDLDTLRIDPVLRIVCGATEAPDVLASQPTLSRLENSVSRTDLLRAAYVLSDCVIARQANRRGRRKVRRITIDMDSTEDPTYGNQQLTFFNAFYDNWCYLPMVTTLQFEDEPDHHLVAPVLRPGNAHGSLGAIAIMKRLLPRLRSTFPRAVIRVRLDGGFATPEVFDWLEEHDLRYVVNMPKNSVLNVLAESLMKEVRKRSAASGRTETAYTEARYQAGKWDAPRRVVIKAEVVQLEGREPRDNPRFVITNDKRSPKNVYRYYCKRGDMENRIKELHYGLAFDRTSCSSFQANQFRNLLTAAAYVLFQGLRAAAAKTVYARAQVPTLRDRLIKIAVSLVESVRRFLLEGPASLPNRDDWFKVAIACGAVGG